MKHISSGPVLKSTLLLILVLIVPLALAAKDKHPSTYRIPLPPKPDFSSLEWLVGNWTGQMLKNSPQGQIHLSVSFDVDHRIMVFREKISLAATQEIPATRESSIGILSSAPSGHSFQLQVYSSTGFINRYRVTVEGSEIDFTPAGGIQPLPGWLKRRTIQRSDVDGFTETVQLAPPQKPFFNYYTVAFIRQSTPVSSKADKSGGHKKP